MGATLLISLFLFFNSFGEYQFNSSLEWLSLNTFKIDLGIWLNDSTIIMIFVVSLVSFLVHIYSISYMKGDLRYSLYFGYLGLFTFSMNGIVIADNLFMLFIFWELVGLSSYLLIGFWFEKDSAANAGNKAFLTNRVGDIGMFIGMMILFYHTQSTIPFRCVWGRVRLSFNYCFIQFLSRA